MHEEMSHRALSRAKRFARIMLVLLGALLALHLALPDGMDGTLALALCTANDTVYAKGFNEIGYFRVRSGMKGAEVQHLLGEPLEETWIYRIRGATGLESNLAFRGDRLAEINLYDTAEIHLREAVVGMSRSEVIARFGPPRKRIWFYTSSPRRICYRERKVIFHRDEVVEKDAEAYFD